MHRLKQRFMRIAMLSLVGVLVFFTLTVNGVNLYLTFLDQQATLDLIREEKGSPFEEEPLTEINDETKTLPNVPHDQDSLRAQGEKEGRFTPETPYTTRYFVLRFDDGGNLSQANLDSIAAVTDDNVSEYLSAAVKQDNGYGLYDSYFFYTEAVGIDHHIAYFLDCYQPIRALKIVFFLTLAVDLICAGFVYLILLRFAKRAVDPIVKNNAAQKQFITDAGHELKTPLTVLTTNLKLLEMEIGENKWITKSQHQTQKLVELVNILIELSKMDESESPVEKHDFDLSAAACEIVDSFMDYAAEKGLRIEAHLDERIQYHGDERAIRRLMTILLDNAIKYAADGNISIRLQREKHHVVIETKNACKPIAPSEMEKLFDRFYRPSASLDAGTKGFGIGLSAAKSIALSHKGSITASSPKPGEIVFTVILK